jgi:hypothetical protein
MGFDVKDVSCGIGKEGGTSPRGRLSLHPLRHRDLKPGPFALLAGSWIVMPGNCRNFMGQEQSRAGVFTKTSIEDFLLLFGWDTHTVILAHD